MRNWSLPETHHQFRIIETAAPETLRRALCDQQRLKAPPLARLPISSSRRHRIARSVRGCAHRRRPTLWPPYTWRRWRSDDARVVF